MDLVHFKLHRFWPVTLKGIDIRDGTSYLIFRVDSCDKKWDWVLQGPM